jgi:transposase
MLGIDVAKAQLVGTLLDPNTEQRRWAATYANTEAGVRALLARTPPDVPWVVEPTGRYSNLVVSLGRAAGRRVLLAQPKRAKLFLASAFDRQKSDPLDSYGLALYGLRCPLAPFPLKSEFMERFDQLQAARRGLSRAISQLRLQLHSLPHATAALQSALTDLEHHRATLDDELQALLSDREQFPMAAALQKVTGIGPVTAGAVLSRLAEKQFGHSDQFVK